MAIACLMLSIATSCVNKSSTQNPQSVGDTLTLNLQRDSFTYVPSIPNSCRYGEFWTGTYGNNGGFNSGEFHFSHNSGVDTFSYWGGFTPSKDADARCFTIKCYTGDSCQCQSANLPCGQDSLDGSWGWIHNQWGCMAGHGLDSIYQESQTAPYLVAYWDYYSDTQGQ
ncbi:MAG: hypothetical protein LBS54_05585, partial [Dysgonamonadaceae bacterium]|nr:hypothetical protein [Dysgonamonadaceae bacterium]